MKDKSKEGSAYLKDVIIQHENAEKKLLASNQQLQASEQQLKASNQQLLDQIQELSRMATVVKDSNDAVLIQDLEGNITAWNAGATKMYGYSEQEAFKMNVVELVPKEYKAEALNFIVSLKKGELVESLETKRQSKYGSILDVWLVFTKLVDKDGKLIGVASTERDITERKQAEVELLKSEEQKYKDLFDNMSNAVAVYEVKNEGKDFIFKDFNTSAEKIENIRKKDILGKNVLDVFPGAKKGFIDVYRKVWKTGKAEFKTNYLYSEEGKIDTVRNFFTYKLPSGEIVAIYEDITEQVEAENIKNALFEISEAVNHTDDIHSFYQRIHEIIKQLMPAENFYISLYDAASDLISFPYFVDEEDEVSAPIKPGRTCTAYVLRTGEPAIIDMELSNELSRRGELEMVGAPSDIWLGVPLKINNKTIGVMAVQEYHNEHSYGENEKKILGFVSEQVASAIYKKRSEEEFKKYTEELIELNASKDKFFSIIAHDLKSPFNSILGFSNLLMEQIRKKDYNGIEKYAEIIKQSSNRSMDLLMNLMEWSRSQTGRMKFEPSYFEIGELIDVAILLLSDTAKQKSIKITKPSPSNITVYADKAMINTVIRNLISNAIKFTPQGGKIDISVEQKQAELMVSVRDTGVGISEANMQKIFRIDENYTTSGTNKEKGTGLGLILCKEFIEKHKGNIWVESEVGNLPAGSPAGAGKAGGSTFYFTVPIDAKTKEKNDIEKILLEGDVENHINPEVSGLKILIAEDDETSLQLISIIVQKFSKELLNAQNGKDTVEACRINPDIDLIMMDIKMPIMDGFEATRQIRKFNKEVIIIAQTAIGLTGDKEKALEAGCNDYISKPINKEELLLLIQKYFEKE